MSYQIRQMPKPRHLTLKEKIALFKEVNHEHALEVAKLEKKYPWYPIVYRWVLTIAITVFAIICAISAINSGIEKRNEALAQAIYIQQQEEQARLEQAHQAELLAAQNMEKARREEEVVLMAKILMGINNFVEKYGYSEGDLRTYCECIINRAINKQNGFPSTISEVILQKNQWVGFSEDNQVIERYYKIAKSVVDNYYSGATRPCSADFCWAELNRDGIWLKNEYSDSRYVRTWRH